MADKKVSFQDLTMFNDESLVFLRRAVDLLEVQDGNAPIAGIPAIGTITITSIPNLNETFTIGPNIFTWKDIRSAAYEVTRGVNGTEASLNLITAVNADMSTLAIASLPPGNANCITTVTAIPTTKGTGYRVGDILTLAEGTNGTVIVLTISGAGLVETVGLYTAGTNYTVGLKSCSGGYGTGCVIAITALGNPPVNVNSILTITTIPQTKGTGYVVGDILNLLGGIGGKVRVETISGAGLVETVSLFDIGTGYTIGNSNCTGGYGTGCIITITAIGNEATVFITAVDFGVVGNSMSFSTSAANMVMNGVGFLGGTIPGIDSAASSRQRYALDAIGATPTELAANIPVIFQAGSNYMGFVGIANTAAAGFGFPVDQRYELTDKARIAYSKIRKNLVFS
jgi:hypothetical protein